MVEENKDESMKDMIKKLNEKIDVMSQQKENKSRFKIPKLSNGFVKKNFVNVIYIKENSNIQLLKMPIENSTISIEGVPRLSTADCVLQYKGKPTIILPAWSMKPFSPRNNYDETVNEKWSIAGRKLIIDRMHRDAIEAKKKMGGMIWWIILGVVALGAGYYLLKGGKFF